MYSWIFSAVFNTIYVTKQRSVAQHTQSIPYIIDIPYKKRAQHNIHVHMNTQF